MREIKFRAWEEKGKDMIYSVRGNFVMEFDGKCSFVEWGSEYFKAMPDLILSQFTGLKDKNEKEIYEGDIVKCQYRCHPEGEFNESIMEVVWDKENCEFSWFLQYRYRNNAIKNIEVIGNIYENPELTKNDLKRSV